MDGKVSICIPAYNSEKTIAETIVSCLLQDYENKEIVVYDDGSTDNTVKIAKMFSGVKVVRGMCNLGVGNALTKCVEYSSGKYVVLMCSDDVFTHKSVISDMVMMFTISNNIGHVSRYYHQFVSGIPGAVRAWRTKDPVLQANNPSGLGFRREAIKRKFSNKMFVESASMVQYVLDDGWNWKLLNYDTVAVRVHQSTSMKKETYDKYWSTSMIEDWIELGVNVAKDVTGIIQIRRGHSRREAFKEGLRYIRYYPVNLIRPAFWFYFLFTMLSPRSWLYKFPEFYRNRIGRHITKEVKR